jgi:1,4-alpha-glucan branching enzyme
MTARSELDPETIAAIVSGRHADPFAVLGAHRVRLDSQSIFVVRAFLPYADAVAVVYGARLNNIADMQKIHDAGLFEASISARARTMRYRLRVTGSEGRLDIEDPYAFPPIIPESELVLLAAGTHYRSYEWLGAHLREVDGVRGTHFAVWAPNAGRASVIGSFNAWDGRVHSMRYIYSTGIWEIFLPGVGEGAQYKFQIINRDFSAKIDKTDPYGFRAELRPGQASIVCDLDAYRWGDAKWGLDRPTRNALNAPIAIYEVHLGSWRRVPQENDRWMTYRELAPALVEYVTQMGYTHIELLPISEHPYDGSWGYQTVGYFAPTSRHGTPADFMYFVDYCHQHGVAVLVDWVPAHFPKDSHGLNYFDGTHLYEYPDPRRGEHQDWGTLIFNYARTEVRNFLLSNALFWLAKYHVDGLRVDAVASMLYLDYSRKVGEWLPNKYGGRENLEAIEFLKRFNELTHGEHPGILTIAEESTAWPMVTRRTAVGGLGFDLKWNMGWMHDMLKYMSMDPIFRRFNHNLITFSLMYAFSENYVLPLSHDEVVHLKKSLLDKMPGDEWKKFATIRTLYGYMYCHPGKKLLFMGGEFGQWREWSEARSLDWDLLAKPSHRQLQHYVADLNRIYADEAALHEVDFAWDGFAWIDAQDVEQSVIAFVRRAQNFDDFVIVVCNFTPVPRPNYRVGVPVLAKYQEILNSDAVVYGGSGYPGMAETTATNTVWQSQPYSIVLGLPPLSVVIIKVQAASI